VHRLLIFLALLVPLSARAQEVDAGLGGAAEQARSAWFAHDAAALGPEQAAALLRDFLASALEVETVVRAARETEPGRGYVELQRRYRITGTQEVRVQGLLLGYRKTRTGWSLVELRVVG